MENPTPQPQQQQPAQQQAQATQPAQQQAQATQPAQAQAPQTAPQSAGLKAAATTAATVKDQTKSNKRFIIGCLGAFGCSIILFIGILFAFLAFGSTTNPIFTFLGVPAEEVVNVLITFINLIFLVLVFAAFIFVIIGVFKIVSAKKDDKDAKRRGAFFAFGALAVMVVLITVWVFAYLFLAQKRTVTSKSPVITDPAKPINLTAPVKVKFEATKSAISQQRFDVLSYDWDFDDGSTANGNPQTHTFTKIGNFKVKLTLQAKEKLTNKDQSFEFTKDVTVQNITANVVIKANKQKGEIPLEINLDGSESNSPNGEITAYSWDLDEDNTFDDGNEPEAKAVFDKLGKYRISLRVTDSTGAFAIGEIEIEAVPSDAPAAVIEVEGVTGTFLEAGKSYVFSASSSTTPEGKIEKYIWQFADGKKAQTRTVTHTFKESGDYDVTLTVINSNNEQGETTQRFTVKNQEGAPVPFVKTTPEEKNNIVSGKAPFTVVFDASASQDPNDNIIEYEWDFNSDSKTDDTNIVTSNTFNIGGTYNVALTLTDASGLTSKTQIVVKVDSAGLTADVTADPIAGPVPLTVSFDASGSSYPEGKIVSYEWDFGDGSEPRIDVAKVSHEYTAIGTFIAKVTAISSDNKRTEAQVPINVRSIPVKACFEPSTKDGESPLEVQFDPNCSTGTIVKYSWNFANLGKSSDYKPKFTFKDPGEFPISLEVTDNQNNVDNFTLTISVK